jgi:hypothetical protein
MIKFIYRFILIFIVANLCLSKVHADNKKFARSYSAYTLPSQAVEFEFWQTARIDKGMGFYYRWQPRFEVEYGVTDRLTTSMYFNFDEVKSSDNPIPSKPLSLSNTSLEFRYRLTNPGEFFVDPALYFEFGYGGDEISYEPKILLSKRLDRFEAVVNIVSEIERKPAESESESEFEIAAGLAYELNPNIFIGLEFRNHRNFENIYEEEKNQASFFGPTISFHKEKLYLVINFLTQISGGPIKTNNLDLDGHEKYEIRAILGVEL